MSKTAFLKNTNTGEILKIGGGNPLVVQSMLSCDTLDKDAVFSQIDSLIKAKCGVIRIAVENKGAANLCKQYLHYSKVPLVADIHFDPQLAITCSEIGFSKIRLNPGNINSDKFDSVVAACKANGTAIRLGVNGGSLDKDLAKKHGVTPKSLALSAINSIKVFEKLNFDNLIVSIKSSCIKTTVLANRLLKIDCPYPLHIGITESGFGTSGLVKSAIGIGAMLLDGIGDTIRVSLTDDPVAEVKAAYDILKALNLTDSVQIISCPTCSRCKFDLKKVASKIKNATKNVDKKIKIAVMGCVVNGPGEAMDADIGVAGGDDGKAAIFMGGKVLKVVSHDKIVEAMKDEIKKILANR
ncbi:MAG: flavodoxin-dependent (E)-4-hydroxy-3-methylbut-2-enyl-diphosphate synthase [Firmicutes bacterium]|nr:flavodoxin-dependent (E)-4-hydroxy-3-methylbut-2-enyl-diphosphate synthase [Bacillota bacterium]